MSGHGDSLNEEFLLELFSLALKNSTLMAVLVSELKENYLPTEEYSAIFKAMCTQWNQNQSCISVGKLMQRFDDDDDIIDLIADIRDTDVTVDAGELIEELEDYIKKMMFVEKYEEIGKTYNKKGGKEKAFNMVKALADRIHNFTLKSKAFDRVFGDFEEDILQKKANLNSDCADESELRVQFGIDPLEQLSGGGIKKGDLVGFLAASGVGKSKYLKWMGLVNARLGKTVLHFQLEGTRDECRSGYRAAASGIHSSTIEAGLIDAEQLEAISRQVQGAAGEVYLKTYEMFGSASTVEVRQGIVDLRKAHNKEVDLVIIDYMEILEPSGKREWSPNEERHRRVKICDELKNIAMEFNCVVAFATQASNLPADKMNDPDFYLSRFDVSESKGIVKPCSWFITINRSDEEAESQQARLFVDKSRYTKAKQKFRIYQNYDKDMFYDRKKTMNLIYNKAA